MTNPDEEARRAEWEARIQADPDEAREETMTRLVRVLAQLFVEHRTADPKRAQAWARRHFAELSLRVAPVPPGRSH